MTTCSDKVRAAFESRIGDIHAMLTSDDDDTRDELFDYGLSFDYVAPNTFDDQPEGYIRYQISYGGPSEEFRFYVSPSHDEYSNPLYRAEFWYLDWFDGAKVNCTSDERVDILYEWFDSCGSIAHAISEAAA